MSLPQSKVGLGAIC